MYIERRFISPLGVNKEGQRIARRFVEMDTNTASLGSRRLQNKHQFVKQLVLFARSGLKANKNVKRHDSLLLTTYLLPVLKRKVTATLATKHP